MTSTTDKPTIPRGVRPTPRVAVPPPPLEGLGDNPNDRLKLAGVQARRIRTRHRMTMQQVADAAGVTPNTIYYFEKGRTKSTTFETLRRIAIALDVEIEDLIHVPRGARTELSGVVHRFSTGPWGAVAQPSTAEIAWLESAPVDWIGEPEEEHLYQLLMIRRSLGCSEAFDEADEAADDAR